MCVIEIVCAAAFYSLSKILKRFTYLSKAFVMSNWFLFIIAGTTIASEFNRSKDADGSIAYVYSIIFMWIFSFWGCGLVTIVFEKLNEWRKSRRK